MDLRTDLNLVSTGHFKIWKTSKESGRSTLVVDKPNTILYTGADLVAKALGGVPNTKISHMYLGYTNDRSYPGTGYAITKTNSTFTPTANRGFIRVPLTFPASFDTSASSYLSNIAVFTVLVANAASYVTTDSPTLTSGASLFYEAALVASLTGLASGDVPLARIAFTPTEYDSAFGATISWGIKINLLTA